MPDALHVGPGLFWRGGPVPLEAVAIDVQVQTSVIRSVLSQRYRNAERVPIEASYVFPLEESSAVCAFEVQVDGLRVAGQLAERERAFATYDDALGDGHGAYLLDQERPDVFTAHLTNLAPGAEVVVILTVVAEPTWAGADLRLVLPTAVAPRYAPARERRGVGRAPAVALNPPRAALPPYGLLVSVRADLGVPLRSVESPSHPIAVEQEGTEARITLSQRAVPLDRDVVLVLRPREQPPTGVAVEYCPGGGAVQLVFQPHFDAGPVPTEVLFLVDASASMRGLALSEARGALLLALRSLAAAHTFNIATFGGTQRLLFPFSQPYDDATLLAGTTFVHELEADQGCTELAAALEALLREPAQSGRPRRLFLFTDGHVTNADEILRVADRGLGAAGVFVFGLGSAPSSHLVRAVARSGHGAAEFIAPGERAGRKVMRQLTRALTPALTHIDIDWGNLEVQHQAPHRLPPLFSGDRAVIHALVSRLTAGVARVRGMGPAGPLEWAFEVDPARAQQAGEGLGQLAARAVLRDIEESDAPVGRRAVDLEVGCRSTENGARRAALLEIAMAHGLASSVTSFVAIEPRTAPSEGPPEARRVPTLITHGWGGRDRRSYIESPRPRDPFGDTSTTAPVFPPLSPRPLSGAALAQPDDSSCHEAGLRGAGIARDQAAPPAERPLERVIALQTAEGWWEPAVPLARELGVPLRELRGRMPVYVGERGDAERAWTTALVLCWLTSEWQGEHGVWGLLARKAQAWLDACAAQPAGGDWLTAARQVTA